MCGTLRFKKKKLMKRKKKEKHIAVICAIMEKITNEKQKKIHRIYVIQHCAYDPRKQ